MMSRHFSLSEKERLICVVTTYLESLEYGLLS